MASTSWITPKTNWISTDPYNIADYNRMKNNIAYICEVVQKSGMKYGIYDSFVKDMGDDITDYGTMWSVSKFNRLEYYLRELGIVFGKGWSQYFHYAGSKFLSAADCNRIESLCAEFMEYCKGWENGRTTLPFTLGGDRTIRV